jgi:hypothetical protein
MLDGFGHGVSSQFILSDLICDIIVSLMPGRVADHNVRAASAWRGTPRIDALGMHGRLAHRRKNIKSNVRRRSTSAPNNDPKRRIAMLPKTVLAGLAAATIIAGSALISTGASAAGGHGGAAGNWPQSGTWNWPEYAGAPACNWTHVKYFDHGKAHWRWEHVCP